MALGTWFDANYFAGQKLEQIKVLQQMGKFDYTVPETGTNQQKLQAVIDAYNTANGANITIDDNFIECNRGDYITSVVARDQINISPNELFDIPYYLTALAKNANDTSYPGAPAGGWTAESVLEAMYNSGYSAWTHFMNDGLDRMIDCSSSFNTKAYLEDKAAATNQTVEEVIAQMKADNLNPVMDYFENGRDLGIEIKPVDTELTVTMTDDALWVNGGIVPPADVDPYDDVLPENYKSIVAGDDGPYISEDGVNTRFEAVWVQTAGASTLAPTDVINAGEAKNTLAIEFGQDWRGFDNSTLGKGVDNVTGVGRIVLDRQEAGSERHLTFDAKNISEDTERFDINAKGTGSTDLKNLSDGVNEINLSGLKAQDVGSSNGKIQSTNLNFVHTANAGTADTLTIGLQDVASASVLEKVTWNTGFETVIINSKGRTSSGQNGIDISSATGIKEIDVKGAADVTIQTTATGVKTYDMHEATGKVTLNANGLSNQTIIGGQGEDTVNLASSGTVLGKNWSGVENVTFGSGDTANATVFNAAGAQDIQQYWIANVGTYKAINVEGDTTVYQTKGAQATGNKTSIEGAMNNGDSSLNNITWQSQTGLDATKNPSVKANFATNADETVTIKLDGADYLASGSSFELSQAAKVVIDAPNANSVAPTVKLTAENATEMSIDWTGGATFAGGASPSPNASAAALGKLQNLTLTLQNASTTTTADQFNMADYKLGAAQNVTVSGGGESVVLGDLGTATGNSATPDLTLNASNVANFSVGKMGVGLGYNVDATINASGIVSLDDITSATNAQSNYQGDVTLTVSGASVVSSLPSQITITGGDLDIDFSGVQGNVGVANSYAVALSAMEGISYQGAKGDDIVNLLKAGVANYSTINTGAGDDQVTIGAGSLANGSNITVDLGSGTDFIQVLDGAVALGSTATINVVCGDGADTLSIATSSGGRRILDIDGFDSAGGDKLAGSFSAVGLQSDGAATANALNEGYGLKLATNGRMISVGGDANRAYLVGDTAYLTDTFNNPNGTLVVLHGVDADATDITIS